MNKDKINSNSSKDLAQRETFTDLLPPTQDNKPKKQIHFKFNESTENNNAPLTKRGFDTDKPLLALDSEISYTEDPHSIKHSPSKTHYIQRFQNGLSIKDFLRHTVRLADTEIALRDTSIERDPKYTINYEALLRNPQSTPSDTAPAHHKKMSSERRREIRQLWRRSIGYALLTTRVLNILGFLEWRAKPVRQASYSSMPKKKWIIYPDNKIKIAWNVIMILLLLYIATVVPYIIAFVPQEPLAFFIIDLSIDCCFLVDIFVTFFSAYYDSKNVLQTQHKNIAQRYIFGWLLLDVVVIFPFHWVISGGTEYNTLLRLLRLPKLYRSFKLVKMIKMFKDMENANPLMEKLIYKFFLYSGQIRLAFTIIIAFLFMHLVACLNFLLARLDAGPDTWYELRLTF